jgi:hypothetical protein
MICSGVGLLLMAGFGGECAHLLLCGLAVHSLFAGMADVINRSRITTLFDVAQSGEVLSIVYSLDGANRVITPIIGGILLDLLGVASTSPFWLCAGSSLLSWWLTRSWVRLS